MPKHHLMVEKFNQYEKFTETTAKYPESMSMEYTALGLAGEVGEYVEKVKKMLRDGVYDRDAAILELGDVLYYLTRCAIHNGVTLEEVATRNVEKLHRRLESGTIHGEGDYR